MLQSEFSHVLAFCKNTRAYLFATSIYNFLSPSNEKLLHSFSHHRQKGGAPVWEERTSHTPARSRAVERPRGAVCWLGGIGKNATTLLFSAVHYLIAGPSVAQSHKINCRNQFRILHFSAARVSHAERRRETGSRSSGRQQSG
jgi:hypothetical protein